MASERLSVDVDALLRCARELTAKHPGDWTDHNIGQAHAFLVAACSSIDALRSDADESEREIRDTHLAFLAATEETTAPLAARIREVCTALAASREAREKAERERDEWRNAWAHLPSWVAVVLEPSPIPTEARQRLAPTLAMFMSKVRACDCATDETGRCACARFIEHELWCHTEAARERGAAGARRAAIEECAQAVNRRAIHYARSDRPHYSDALFLMRDELRRMPHGGDHGQ